MQSSEPTIKCDGCNQQVPESSTGSCIGYRLHDGDILKRLKIEKSRTSLLGICSFEGGYWFCKECLDRHSFCKTCQKETTPEERQKVSRDL